MSHGRSAWPETHPHHEQCRVHLLGSFVHAGGALLRTFRFQMLDENVPESPGS